MSSYRPVAPMGAPIKTAGGVRANYEGFVRQPKPDKSREGFCVAKGGTCRARKAKGTDYCVGHLRSIEKEVTDEQAAAEGRGTDAD